MLVQKLQKPRAIFVTRKAEHPTGSFVNEVFVVAEQQLGDLVSVVQLTSTNEISSADDRRAALPHVLRTRELVKNLAWLVEQVAADDMNRTDVNQIPVVNAVMSPEI